jgi:hypothetical protein
MEKVLQLDGPIFDGFDPYTRNQILHPDLHTLPVFDDGGHEIRIYSSAGVRIPRVKALCGRDAPTAGVLVRLDTIKDLFSGPSGSEENSSPISVTVYPQSYFSNLGHVKANTAISSFQKIIDKVNCDIMDLEPEALHHHANANLIRPVTPISSQFYNQLSHRLATRAGTQQVQRGEQTTASAAGYSGYSIAALHKGKTLLSACSDRLPFTRHFDLLDEINPEEDTPTDLRAENVFLLDMRAVHPANRKGRCARHLSLTHLTTPTHFPVTVTSTQTSSSHSSKAGGNRWYGTPSGHIWSHFPPW